MLLSDGIITILELFDTSEDIIKFINIINEKFSNYTLLLKLRYDFQFLKENFGFEVF